MPYDILDIDTKMGGAPYGGPVDIFQSPNPGAPEGGPYNPGGPVGAPLTYNGNNYVVPGNDLEFLRAVLSQEAFGALLHARRMLRPGSPDITILDLIRSDTTSGHFAELVAAKTRQGSGGSAQPGQLWINGCSNNNGGSNGNNSNMKMSYNLHSGIKHRELNNRDVRWHLTWFQFVYKSSDPTRSDALYWSPPSRISSYF